jgi:hypothetical protein
MTASGLSPRHQTSVTKATLALQVQQARWVFKELQVQQVRVAQQVHKDCAAKQAQLVYKDLQAQLVPRDQQVHRDF